MPSQSEVSTRLTADNSQYRSVMNQSEQVADKVGKSIFKKLDIRAGVTAVAVAIGFSMQKIADGIARMVIGFSKDQEDALNKTVEQLDKLADKQEQNLKKAQEKSKKDAEDRIEREYDTYKIILAAKDKAREQELQAEKNHRQKLFDLQQDKDETHAKYVDDNIEKLRLEAKAVQGLTVHEANRLKVLQLITQQIDIEYQIRSLLALKDRTPQEEALLQTLIKQSSVLTGQISTVGQIKDEIAKIEPVIESNIAAWEKFKGSITSTGRGDTQLSDRELERKIATIQKQLGSAGAGLGTYQGAAGGTGSSDFLTSQQRGAAAAARAELDFRQRVRQTANTFGEDAAFRQFSGLTEQSLREILQTAPGTADVVAELKTLNGHLKQGIPTVLYGNDT